jgi:PIN domain nuclease of toxin-antitoxin system
VLEPTRLSAKARDGIVSTRSRVFVSVINGWEIAVKKSLGKMAVPDDMEARITRACGGAGFDLLPVELRHAFEVQSLPWHHKDPFDRLLVAQARVERLTLVSIDRAVRAYAVDVLW